MQIDFHHGATYTVARLAGMSHEESEIIAHAAQYVDDATNDGYIKFDNGATYGRIATAHKMLDYTNFKELENHRAWVPFHFLPGNDLKAANDDHDKSFIYRLICRPNSHPAHDMIHNIITSPKRPYSLHQLGITMHVFIDTWAHYGFCGTTHKINRANNIKITKDGNNDVSDEKLPARLKSFFKHIFDNTASDFVEGINPLGHGAVLSYPDMPYLQWKYTNGNGETIIRDNPKDFLEATCAMYEAIYRYRLGDPKANVPPMNNSDVQKIADMIISVNDEEGKKRHERWLDAIATGHFSFGAQKLDYIPKGVGSWKHAALKTEKFKDGLDEIFKYDESFLSSNWKMFHDAAQIHRFHILHDILPRYGICVG